MSGQSRLTVVPVTLAEANKYIEAQHRHNGPLPGAKFALAVCDPERQVHGVAIAGQPKARLAANGFTLEVSRVCTDGTPNACSALYGACVRAGKALGYARVITYTLCSEPGVSLRAAGFIKTSDVQGESWARRQRSKGDRTYRDSHDTGDKQRWEVRWERSFDPVTWPDGMFAEPAPQLFGAAT